METFYPDYYSEFTCTADRCPVTCCQEWKINVDDITKEKWKSLTPPDFVQGHKKNLHYFTEKKEGQRVIRLTDTHRCPFLTENLLCGLVLTYGAEVLSDTCTAFPREYHDFQDHKEASLMPCCPAVIDLWQKRESLSFPKISSFVSHPAFLLREKITALMQEIAASDDSLKESLPEESLHPSLQPDPSLALMESFYILQELHRNEAEGQLLDKDIIHSCFHPSTLKELQKAICNLPGSPLDTICECNELLQDLSVNYLNEGQYTDYLNPLITSAEQLHEADSTWLLSGWNTFIQQLQQFYPLLRSFLANEIYSDLLISDDMTIEHMLIRMQWIAIQYAAIRQALFLTYLSGSNETLSYESVRQSIVILTRMTGYEEEDIYDYLENSFESLLWDFGYLALIMGNT